MIASPGEKRGSGMSESPARLAPESPTQSLRPWSRETDAWRWARRLDQRYVNSLFRVRSATVIPASLRARIAAMGIPADITEETLREIRRLDQWANAWIETAQRFLGDYRRQISGSQRADAAQARMLAGYCYHIAQLAPGPDARTLEHSSATAAALVRQALPDVLPQARRIDVPWRTSTLPAILIPGPDTPEPSGLVVVLNGTSTTKEEHLRSVGAFVSAGLATLLLDVPGTGEARHLGPPASDQMDLLDGVFELLRGYHAIDARKVGVLGVSLGGNLALRCLAYDRRIAGAAMVTPPVDPARWIDHASPLIRDEMQRLFQTADADELRRIAASFSLEDVTAHIQRPTLILGAGRDMVVPPSESTRLASALGPLATLAWYANGGHALYGEIPAWTADAAYWFRAIQQHQSTRVDDIGRLSETWREALSELPPRDLDWDEDLETTRLLQPDEVDPQRRAPSRRGPEPADGEGSSELEEPEPQLDDEYSRAFSARPQRRRTVPRRRPTPASRHDDLPGQN
jgi:alpha-beta hydrolase superfamily lysophospholipase